MTDARCNRRAIETFERLGARPWASRACNELRATGQTKPARRPLRQVAVTHRSGDRILGRFRAD
jgi:hypothetical protein